jgi:hypothetical protein
MKIICDTHVPIFYQDRPERLSAAARKAFARGRGVGSFRLPLRQDEPDFDVW